MKSGWAKAVLGELCGFENGDRGKNYPGRKALVSEGVPFINAGHIEDGHIHWDEMDFIPEDRFDLLGSGKVQEGDILFCLRGSLGKFGVVDRDGDGAIASSLVIVRPGASVDRSFLAFYFRSPLCAEMIERYAGGAAQPNLSAKSLKSFVIPLPSLEEQQRIVAVLDEVFEGLARVRAHAEANLQNARELFEQGVTTLIKNAAEEGEQSTVGSVCTFENGDRGKNYPGRKAFVPEGVPFINAGHLDDGVIKWGEMNFIPEEHFHRLSKGKTRRNDLLFCLRGSLGKFGVVDQDGMAAIASSLVIVRCGEGIARDYLAAYFASSACASEIEKFAGGAAQPNLSAKSLAAFRLPLPAMQRQLEVATAYEGLKQGRDSLAVAFQRKLADLDDLRQSLLQKAFAGELT